MLSTIRFCCAHCGARIKAPTELVGQARPCPKCNRDITVKWQTPEDQGPILADNRQAGRPDSINHR